MSAYVTYMDMDSDLIIVGGSLTGSLAALALADIGLTSTVIDIEAPRDMLDEPFDGRTTALAYAGARMLDKLGLWEGMKPGASPINDILVTDGKPKGRFSDGYVAPGFIHFDSRELGEDGEHTPLGWIIENRLMRHVFFEAMVANDKINLIAPARCQGMKAHPGYGEVTLHDDRILRGRLVLAADGRPSPLRERAKIKSTRWQYSQTGIVCTVAHEKDHLGIAQEIFLPSGPFAILPLPNNRSSLVWTEKKDRVRAFVAMDEASIIREITARFGSYLGDVKLDGPVWSYPLSFHIATKFYTDRMALIGDAAHGVHPIAGQGFNLGVKDIAVMRDVLLEATQTGLDIGHGTQLAKYDRWRRFDSVSLGFGMDALNKLMSTDNSLLRKVRSTGMSIVNKIDPLRQAFMKQAGGDLGDLPELMRG